MEIETDSYGYRVDPYTYGDEYLGYIYNVVEARCGLLKAENELHDAFSRLRFAAKNGITDSHKRVLLDIFVEADTPGHPGKILKDLEDWGLLWDGEKGYELTPRGIEACYKL